MRILVSNTVAAFTKTLFVPSEKYEKYGCDFIMTKNSKVFVVADAVKTPTTAEGVMNTVAEKLWPGRGAKKLSQLPMSKRALRDGNLKIDKNGAVYPGYEDLWYFAAKSTSRPTVVDRDKSPLTAADGRVYSGCIMNASFDLYGYADSERQGVFAALISAQFVADGEPLGAGGAASTGDEYEDLSVGAGASDLL